MPFTSSHLPNGRGALPLGHSATAPASMRMEAFHFLALPQPACCSYCVGVKVRRSTGCTAHAVHEQTTLISASRKVPLMVLQMIGIWKQCCRRWAIKQAGVRASVVGSNKQTQARQAGRQPHCEAHSWPHRGAGTKAICARQRGPASMVGESAAKLLR